MTDSSEVCGLLMDHASCVVLIKLAIFLGALVSRSLV